MIRVVITRVCRHPARFVLYLTVVATLVYIALFRGKNPEPYSNQGTLNVPVHSFVHSFMHLRNGTGEQACVQAKFELYPNEKFREFFAETRKPTCPGSDWVKVENGVFKVLDFAKKNFGDISCEYRALVRGSDDFHYDVGEAVNIKDGDNVTHDVMKVSCRAGSAQHHSYQVSVPFVESIHQRVDSVPLPKEALGLNVLMFGFDSVSRMSWQRKLPKSYAYMMNVLKFIVLEGYNIVGDGTPAALLPILTGKTEEELPEVRRGHKGAQHVNVHPWIWDDFKRAGYVTHYTEDQSTIGTFTFRMRGFKDQPTDHYLRHFYMELEKQSYSHCVGSQFRHNYMLKYLKDLETRYKAKRRFNVGFLAMLSHDSNAPLNIIDDDLKEWLGNLYNNGLLNNTMFILMSDHGARFQKLRETVQGKMEERNAFFSVRVPEWFKNKYPSVYNNLVTNSQRLTTPFDIHATFKDILKFEDKSRGSVSKRGISLFSEIPPERTCAHASVAPHWCNCMQWTLLKNDSDDAKMAAEAFINLVNSLTAGVRNLCSTIELDKIVEAKSLTPDSNLLKFKGTDYDGNVDLTMDQKLKAKLFQLVVHTQPGGGHFEVTVTQDVETRRFFSDIKDVSRTNRYGDDPACITSKLPYLSRFCYCTKSLTSTAGT